MIPTTDTIQRATEILHQIEGLQGELASLFGSTRVAAPKRRGRPPGPAKVSATSTGASLKREREMSAAGRARIAAAAKARWAKLRAKQGPQADDNAPAPVPAKPARKVGGMSAAGRAAIAAAQKARWAKVRAAKTKAGKA